MCWLRTSRLNRLRKKRRTHKPGLPEFGGSKDPVLFHANDELKKRAIWGNLATLPAARIIMGHAGLEDYAD